MENLAEVRLWGKRVGALAHDPESGISTFEYAPSWRDSGVEIAPIHMPLAEARYRFPDLPWETFRGLPAVFADALPDDFGNAVINAWLARNGRDPASFSPVERLLYTGSRGMGALEFLPAIDREEATDELQLDSLVAIAQKVLDERAHFNQNLVRKHKTSNNNHALEAILQVGTSAGGARAKAIIAINRERTKIRSGQLDAPEGYEHFLLKFDGVEEHKTDSESFGDPQGYGHIEYAYFLMARDAGVNMADSELLEESGRAHFMTRRFDRVGKRKLHYLSLCAMDHADFRNPGGYSYEQLLSVARQLRLSRDDAIEIYRRMVFNVVSRNHDDHTKNFGFLLDSPKDRWRLAPAFDISYSYKKNSPWVNVHQMSLNGKRDNFVVDDLLAVAGLIGNFRDARDIIQRAVAVVREWDHYAGIAGVFPEMAEVIRKHLRLGKVYGW